MPLKRYIIQICTYLMVSKDIGTTVIGICLEKLKCTWNNDDRELLSFALTAVNMNKLTVVSAKLNSIKKFGFIIVKNLEIFHIFSKGLASERGGPYSLDKKDMENFYQDCSC